MSDNEDRELQALQRQLDDAFETTRPRAGFEDDLWSRMQARRPLGAMVRDFFAGLTAWDTQRIKEMYDPMEDGTVVGRKAVMGALTLYLDFINLFMMLLQLFGARRND